MSKKIALKLAPKPPLGPDGTTSVPNSVLWRAHCIRALMQHFTSRTSSDTELDSEIMLWIMAAGVVYREHYKIMYPEKAKELEKFIDLVASKRVEQLEAAAKCTCADKPAAA